MTSFLEEREQKIRDLQVRQAAELQHFDDHSLSLGFGVMNDPPSHHFGGGDDTDSVHSLNLGALGSPRTPSTSSR